MRASSIHEIELARANQPSWMDRFARSALMKILSHIKVGQLNIHEDGEVHSFGEEDGSGLVARVYVNHSSVWRNVLFGGTVGSGEAYMLGSWSSPDLVKVIRIFVANRQVMLSMDDRKFHPERWLRKLFHRGNSNSSDQAKLNIAAHYDLSNDFFSTFLDQTMMYSSGMFFSGQDTLHQASVNKLENICQRLQLNESHHLVEIGTGWGGMAVHAALRYGCKVTTTTISEEQYKFACARVKALGLEDQVTVLMEDYRKLEGKFDRLVSIEMIEAVGHEFYPEYFAKCSDLLKDDGMMLIQAITIPDQNYHRALGNVDFIQRYIFPGGCLPCHAEIMKQVAENTDLQLAGLEDITADYACTLELWKENFMGHLEEVRRLGFSEEFIRMWDFYLSYCQGGFTERVIGTSQLLMVKPRCQELAAPVA